MAQSQFKKKFLILPLNLIFSMAGTFTLFVLIFLHYIFTRKRRGQCECLFVVDFDAFSTRKRRGQCKCHFLFDFDAGKWV